MKVFKFILWLWENMSTHNRVVFIILMYVLGALVTSFVFGAAMGLYFIFGFAITAGVSMVLYLVFRVTKDKWKEYNRYIEKEQQMVVDRLRGR